MNKNKRYAYLVMIAGLIALIFAIVMFATGSITKPGTGISVSNQYYGGDAYTGIQNASAATARNVQTLSEIAIAGFRHLSVGLGALLLVLGIILISISLYWLSRINSKPQSEEGPVHPDVTAPSPTPSFTFPATDDTTDSPDSTDAHVFSDPVPEDQIPEEGVVSEEKESDEDPDGPAEEGLQETAGSEFREVGTLRNLVPKPAPERIERKVPLPKDDDPDLIWSDDYLFKIDGKWYEHHEGESHNGSHNDGWDATWERPDLDDGKVAELI